MAVFWCSHRPRSGIIGLQLLARRFRRPQGCGRRLSDAPVVTALAGSLVPVILRPTAKAARVLGIRLTAGVEPGDNDWNLNILRFGARKHALLAHTRTAFPILVPDVRVAQLRPLGAWLAATITAALEDEQLPLNTLGDLDHDEPVIGKTVSRQVRGFMTQAALLTEYVIHDAGGLHNTDFHALNRHLRRDLHNYSGRYATPLELITGRRR